MAMKLFDCTYKALPPHLELWEIVVDVQNVDGD